MNEWDTALDQAMAWIYGWLIEHSTVFREHQTELADIAFIRQCMESIVVGRKFEQHVLFFQALRENHTVGVGFFQSSGRNVAIHTLGVADTHLRRGIGSTILAWYLGGLPGSALGGTCGLGTDVKNTAIRAWAKRFDSTEEDRTVYLGVSFPIVRACVVLNSPVPSGDQHTFTSSYGGLTFRLLYAGRHPALVDEVNCPIIQRPCAEES